ncbi:hypothetical protein ACKUUI_22095 [Mycobacterium seoulense]|uniref:hypothetical protein n=1 Tax=Mycobacterium seoulense TaxID=386911 RepID=UPI003CE88070
MVENQPWGSGERPPVQPSPANLSPNFFRQPVSRPHPWLAIGVVLTAAVAIAALIVAVMRPATKLSTTTTAPTPTASETAAAERQLCDTYKLAARAVEVDTGGNDRALARIATTNGAVMLDNSVASPALDAKHRDAARALAGAYSVLTAMSNKAVATDAQYQAALDDITAKDAVMKSVCANGGG